MQERGENAGSKRFLRDDYDYGYGRLKHKVSGIGLYLDEDGVERAAALPRFINAQGFAEYEEMGQPIVPVVILPPNAEYFQQDHAWGFFVAGFFIPLFWLWNMWFLSGHPNASARQLSFLSALMFVIYVIALAVSIVYGKNPWGY